LHLPKKKYRGYFLILLLSPLFIKAQNCRYYQRIFSTVNKTANIIYGNAPALTAIYFTEASTTNQNLTLDIFQPTPDTATKRALIIFAHSGGFINGTKDNDDMQALCDSFAHLGYVTATVNYRLNFNLLSSSSSERAVWRGVQDASAAVRFFKHNAALYKIDSSNIFLWGSSAGSFMSLGLAYIDDAERPASTYSGFLQPDLGCKDCTGNAYTNSSLIKGVISCWGATKDTSWIHDNNNIPALLFHGTADATVPYNEGYPFGLTTIAYVRGSNEINQQLNRTSIYHEFYSETGLGHEYWGTSNGAFPPAGPNAYWVDIITKSKLFLIGRMGSSLSCINLATKLTGFTGNASNGKINLYWNTLSEDNLKNIVVERSMDGINFEQLISILPKTGSGGASYSTIDAHPFPGLNFYRLKITDRDDHFTYSETIKFKTGVTDLSINQVYPNPVVDNLFLEIQSAKHQVIEFAVYETAGKLLCSFSVTLNEGINKTILPFSNLSNGIYFIHYKNDQGEHPGAIKIIKAGGL
jgi:poly(3-hydroxybutyrate) depolymerase